MKEPLFDCIAFDADDTLWHNEHLYLNTADAFKHLLAPYAPPERVAERLNEVEIDNLGCYGYGIKAFALSLIETAIDLSDGRITGAEIRRVIDLARAMLAAEVHLLDHAEATVKALAARYPLMVITKGDPLDQEAKVRRSGLAPYFRYVEVVADKTRDIYAAILSKYRLDPARFLMVGNSLRSDILPVVALGGRAVYVPYRTTWAHEHADPTPAERERFFEIEHLGLLPGLVERLEGGGKPSSPAALPGAAAGASRAIAGLLRSEANWPSPGGLRARKLSVVLLPHGSSEADRPARSLSPCGGEG